MNRQSGSPEDRPARILIVDDEPLNVDYLEQELESHGFDTETATDGVEALEQVAADPPDLVLLDVMMPRMDGISTLRVLKGDPETRLIPVVVMTALNAMEDRVRGIEAGADDFLTKPVDHRELLARIGTSLDLRRAIGETVGELRSASAQLERYGRQEREVAILAIEWRLAEASLPDDAVGFVARRDRATAAERIRALGGLPAEADTGPLVAVFDGPDPRSRAVAAVETAQAVLAAAVPDDATGAVVAAAVSIGPTQVGSTRVQRGNESRWAYTAEGGPVDRATALARGASSGGLVIAGDAAGPISDRFALEPEGGGAYRVVAPAEEDELPGAHDRRIATILVTDIVGSTKTVESIGDRAWSELLRAHDRATRQELTLFGGEEVDTTGDGFLIAFDTPGRAIRCALALADRVADLGLAIRAGVHTGEVEYVGGRAQGIALNLATRIAARAKSGEVLVSDTTRELAAGSGLEFGDRGEHTLKGVSGQRRVYAASEERSGPPQRSELYATARAADGPAEYPEGLTAREVEVLTLVAAGLTDAEVAKRLIVSVRTVNAHMRSIYRKLGVSSRAAAGRFAAEHDLL
jgi:DNA-binding NarL/FixJ family response regulator